MANNVRIELNSEGVRELLRSPEILSACMEAANGVRSNYGGETELSPYVGENRCNVSVIASYDEASEDNGLLKAVY